VRVDDPFWCEVNSQRGNIRDGKGYVEHLNNPNPSFPFNLYTVAVVIIHDPKHKREIKKLLDEKGLVS